MLGPDLDICSSEAASSVFERLPMTVVLHPPWHVCGTPCFALSFRAYSENPSFWATGTVSITVAHLAIGVP